MTASIRISRKKSIVVENLSVTQEDKQLIISVPQGSVIDKKIYLYGNDPQILIDLYNTDQPVMLKAEILIEGDEFIESYYKLIADAKRQMDNLLAESATLSGQLTSVEKEVESLAIAKQSVESEKEKLIIRKEELIKENDELQNKIKELENAINIYENMRSVKAARFVSGLIKR